MIRILATILICLVTLPSAAQDPLSISDDATTVRDISFRFTDTKSISIERLEAEMATLARGSRRAPSRITRAATRTVRYLMTAV